MPATLPASGLCDRIIREVEVPLLSLSPRATRGNQIRAAELPWPEPEYACEEAARVRTPDRAKGVRMTAATVERPNERKRLGKRLMHWRARSVSSVAWRSRWMTIGGLPASRPSWSSPMFGGRSRNRKRPTDQLAAARRPDHHRLPRHHCRPAVGAVAGPVAARALLAPGYMPGWSCCSA